MWYSATLGNFAYPQEFVANGVKYPAGAFNDSALLSSLTIYPLSFQVVDDRYYIKGSETRNLVNNIWEVTYSPTDRPLADVKVEAKGRQLTKLNSIIRGIDPYEKVADNLSSLGLSSQRNLLSTYKYEVYKEISSRITDLNSAASVSAIATLEASWDSDGMTNYFDFEAFDSDQSALIAVIDSDLVATRDADKESAINKFKTVLQLDSDEIRALNL